jgi:NADH/NAD ratio-sensing transcriptional regulator Rex
LAVLLLKYRSFEKEGIKIVAAFDNRSFETGFQTGGTDPAS